MAVKSYANPGGLGTCWQGRALAMQGEVEVPQTFLRQGLAAVLATGQERQRLFCLVLLAGVAGHASQVEEGLRLLAIPGRRCTPSGWGSCWRRSIGVG